jgi:hypothetical protein
MCDRDVHSIDRKRGDEMIVTLAKWETIRDRFSDDEKDALNAANIGETICPRGIIVDEKQLSAKILEKLRRPA